MLNRLKTILPLVAVAGIAMSVLSVAVTAWLRSPLLVESPETRAAADSVLTELEAMRPGSLDDAAFRRAVAEAPQRPSMAASWLLTPEGRVVYASGITAASTPLSSTAEELATDETRRVLATLPDDVLSPEQRTWLLAAAAIQREGDHNDILRHRLAPVRAPDGRVVGLVGLAYAASAEQPGALFVAVVLTGLIGLVVYWLAVPLWVLLDARQHGERAWLWAMFAMMGNLGGLLTYLLVRKRPGDSDSPLPSRERGRG